MPFWSNRGAESHNIRSRGYQKAIKVTMPESHEIEKLKGNDILIQTHNCHEWYLNLGKFLH